MNKLSDCGGSGAETLEEKLSRNKEKSAPFYSSSITIRTRMTSAKELSFSTYREPFRSSARDSPTAQPVASHQALLLIDPDRCAHILYACTAALVTASTIAESITLLTGHKLFGLTTLFYVDQEKNLPTLFSMLLLLCCALLLGLCAHQSKLRQDGLVKPWVLLALAFVFLGFDEAAEVHELLTSPTRKLLGVGKSGILFFAWVVPVGLGVVASFLLYIPFLRKLANDTRNRFLASAAVFLSGALGCELAGGKVAHALGSANVYYFTLTTLEESLEMVGAIMFIRAILLHLGSQNMQLSLELKQPEP